MTPNTTQTADTFTTIETEQYKKGELHPAYGYFDSLHKCQATEIAELKPLARFGALTMASRILMNHDYGTIDRAIEAGLLSDEGADGLVLRDIVYKPNIEATITQLLKD